MIAIKHDGAFVPIANYDNFHITHKQDGKDELHFSVATNDPQYRMIIEEAEVQTDAGLWLVKKISDSHIDCELDLDELRISVYWNYTSGSIRISELLAAILPEWTIIGADAITIRRTVTIDYGNDLDIITRAATVFGVAYRWNTRQKMLTVINPAAITVSGEYLTTELNLRKLTYKGETTDFATRLYAVGADGLTPRTAVIDGVVYGKDYVEDYTYSDKVITAFWKDERYTVAEDLYEDALARLLTMSRPVQSYECDVVDLAKRSDDYAFLEFVVHRKLTLIDTDRGIRVVHSIVEYDEYPEDPASSKVTLASVAPDVATMTTAKATAAEVEARNAALEALGSVNEEISAARREWEVTAAELRSLIQTTETNYTLLQQTVNTIQQVAADQNVTISQILDPSGVIWTAIYNNQNDITNLGNAVSQDSATRKTYMRFLPEEPALVIGIEDENEIKLKLVNNVIYFFSGQDDTTDLTNAYASFDSEKAHAKRFTADEAFDIAPWSLHIETNGNLVLDYIG